MSRCRSWIAVVAILTVATALVAVALPERAEASSVKSRLRVAKHALRHSKDRLRTAEAALAAAEAAETALGTTTIDPSVTPSADPSTTPSADPSATPTPDASATPAIDASATATPTPAATATAAACLSVEELRARVIKVRRAVRTWTRRVNRLSRQYRLQQDLARWERQHEWMKIIEVAAARYDVRAGGIYRMMMRESGGHRYAGSSTAFKGLFQYWTGTWKAGWNPWRGDSIYDGSSQIFATAYAIHKGLGPQMWTTTFAALY